MVKKLKTIGAGGISDNGDSMTESTESWGQTTTHSNDDMPTTNIPRQDGGGQHEAPKQKRERHHFSGRTKVIAAATSVALVAGGYGAYEYIKAHPGYAATNCDDLTHVSVDKAAGTTTGWSRSINGYRDYSSIQDIATRLTKSRHYDISANDILAANPDFKAQGTTGGFKAGNYCVTLPEPKVISRVGNIVLVQAARPDVADMKRLATSAGDQKAQAAFWGAEAEANAGAEAASFPEFPTEGAYPLDETAIVDQLQGVHRLNSDKIAFTEKQILGLGQ